MRTVSLSTAPHLSLSSKIKVYTESVPEVRKQLNPVSKFGLIIVVKKRHLGPETSSNLKESSGSESLPIRWSKQTVLS